MRTTPFARLTTLPEKNAALTRSRSFFWLLAAGHILALVYDFCQPCMCVSSSIQHPATSIKHPASSPGIYLTMLTSARILQVFDAQSFLMYEQIKQYPILRWSHGGPQYSTDELAVEVPLEIRLIGKIIFDNYKLI